jgi:hypothetical protein
MDLLKLERVGRMEERSVEADDGSNSPKRHCPQKAVAAQAATATSKLEVESRRLTSCVIIFAFTGGLGVRRELFGARLCTPLRTKRKRALPFHSMLCVTCQALRAERRLRGVLLECLPTLDAAKAHSTNSSAGNRKCSGTPSKSQKRMNCSMAPE